MFKGSTCQIIFLCVVLFCVGCGGGNETPQDPAAPIQASDPQELTKSAVAKQAIGAYEEAVAELNRALSIDPKYVPAHYQMGSVYEEWDKREEAVAAYKKALAIDPAHKQALLGLGAVYSKQLRNEWAIEQYKKVAEMTPADPEIHFKIALEYWYIQKLPETAEYYRKAIEIDPGHLQAHLNLASVYEKMKDWEGKSRMNRRLPSRKIS